MREKKGTTLIEMMVAIAILAFVALAVIMALVSIQQAWLKQKSGIELFNNARWAMESMVNEIRRGCNYTVDTAVGVDGLRFRSPLVADTEYIFYWRGNGTAQYGNSDVIFRGVGADLLSASSSSSRKEVVNLVDDTSTSSVFSVSDNNLVAIELTVRKGKRSCVLKSKACPRNRDPYTKLLIHADERPSGTTTLADSSSRKHTITSVGVSTTNTQSKFGGLSAAFDVNGDYLSVANNTDFVFGTGDFTIDGWIYINSLGTGPSIVSNRDGVWSATEFIFKVESDNHLQVDTGLAILVESAGSVSTGDWNHVAVTRSGTTLRLFINGVKDGEVTNSNNFSKQSQVNIGGNDPDGGRYLNGYLDELRVSKGIARWTSNFTRPSMDYQD